MAPAALPPISADLLLLLRLVGVASLISVVVLRLLGRGKRTSHGPLPPSPPHSLPILGHFHLLRKPLHRTLARLSALHGPILLLRFGSRRVLHVSSLSVAIQCFTTHDLALATRPNLAVGRILGGNNTGLGFAPYGDLWRNLRRIAAVELLSTQRLDALAATRAEEVAAFAKALAAWVGVDGKPTRVEMRSRLFGLVLNVMMRTVVGKRLDGGGGGEGEVMEIVEETFRLAGETNLGDHIPLLKWVAKLGLERRMASLRLRRDGFVQGLIDERRRWAAAAAVAVEGSGRGEERKTMLDVMLSLQEQDCEYYTDDVVKGMITSMVSAGTDTTATMIEWVMSLLLNHPRAIDAARAEMEQVVAPGEMLGELHLQQLPYLQAILSETLRLCPAGPLLVPHESREDLTIAGYHIPRGTMVLANVWAMHRDGGAWEEAELFKPERFLSGDGSARTMPFGLGRRSCPGEALAVRMVGLVVATLLRCFQWERVGEEEVDMREGSGLTMPKLLPLVALCRLRDDMAPSLLTPPPVS